MSEKHPIEEIMGVSMDKIREMVDINTIIGEPISSPDGRERPSVAGSRQIRGRRRRGSHGKAPVVYSN